jgi:hypothetical protein
LIGENTFAFLGVENREKGTLYAQRHPKDDIHEDILPIDTSLYVSNAMEFLRSS